MTAFVTTTTQITALKAALGTAAPADIETIQSSLNIPVNLDSVYAKKSGPNTFENPNSTPTDSYNIPINSFRDMTGKSGGTRGWVNPGIMHRTITSATQQSFEWAILAIVDNHTTTSAEHVAVYGQINKYSGNSWAGCFEASDKSGVVDPTTSLIGIEVDVFATGTDANKQRIGIDMVAGTTGNTRMIAHAGLRLGPTNGVITNGMFNFGVNLLGEYNVGVDLSDSTTIYNIAAVRLKQGDFLAFNDSATHRLGLSSGGALVYRVDGTDVVSITDTGSLNASNITIGNTQVLSTRVTGWSPMSGTSDSSTVLNIASVTLSQLAARVAALQSALTHHGIIGT